MPEIPSPRPTIRVSGVTRTVGVRLFKLMSDVCNLEPQRITLAELGAILDAGFRAEIYARTDNFGVEDYDGFYDGRYAGLGVITHPDQLGPEWRERFAEMLDQVQQTTPA